jgi:hypothetical protein
MMVDDDLGHGMDENEQRLGPGQYRVRMLKIT